MTRPTLTLRLEGKGGRISANDFATALRCLNDLLDEIAHEMGEDRVEWDIAELRIDNDAPTDPRPPTLADMVARQPEEA